MPVTSWFVIIGIVAAILIIIAAVFLIKGGKQKEGASSSTNDWQNQSLGAPTGVWNQQQQPGGNAWNNQQSGGAWGNQQMPAPATAPTSGWGNQTQQPTPNPWSNQQQQPPAANPWGAQQPSSTVPSWDNQQQQPAANPWAAQQQQQPAANSWAAQQQQQPAANPWNAQQQQQQPAANPWAAQQQQQPASSWGAQTPSAPAQESWNQTQQAWGQSGASSPAPSPQTGPAFGGAAASEPAWGKPAQAESWGAGGAGTSQSTSQPLSANNQSWQQQQPGGFGQQGNMGGNFVPPDSDKTILRPAGASTGSGVGYVRVEEGKEPGRIYEVRKEALSIGRSRESDIFLEDLAVSRLHASIVNMGNGNYALKDEGSANGTKVNGQLVNKFQTYPLQEGHRIQLGQTVLVFGQR